MAIAGATNLRNPFGDRAPVDEINGCSIFNWDGERKLEYQDATASSGRQGDIPIYQVYFKLLDWTVDFGCMRFKNYISNLKWQHDQLIFVLRPL